MATPLDPKQVVSFEELLMSQVVQQEALTRLLVKKGIFTKEEFLEMVKLVNQEIKRKKNSNNNRTSKINLGRKTQNIRGTIVMESLGSFVERLRESVGCYYHPNKDKTLYSLKKFDSNQSHQMGVFGWVLELKRKHLFRIDTYKHLSDKGAVSDLADGIKEGMHFNEEGTGIFFYVKKGSHGEDYQKAVKALRAVMVLN